MWSLCFCQAAASLPASQISNLPWSKCSVAEFGGLSPCYPGTCVSTLHHEGCRFTMQVTIHARLLIIFWLRFEEMYLLFDSGKRKLLDIMIGKCTK